MPSRRLRPPALRVFVPALLGALALALAALVAPRGATGEDDPDAPWVTKLVLRCPTAGALVWVDGERWGALPVTRPRPKERGSVKVVVLLEDHVVLRRRVSIKLESDTEVDLPALKPEAWPRFEAPEGVVAGWESKEFGWFVDGKAPPGPGRLALGRRGFASQVGPDRRLAAKSVVPCEPGPWEPRPAVLDLWDAPAGTAVYLDGKAADDGAPVPPGSHALRIVRRGDRREETVEVRPGQRVVRLPARFTATAQIDAAHAWFARHQQPGGRWSAAMDGCTCKPYCTPGPPEHDVGVTGLALLALLDAGNTPDSGPHADAVAAGLAYLVRRQSPEGFFQTPGTRSAAFGQPIAELAVLEAWGATGDAALGAAAERGVEAILSLQNPYLAWRYGFRDGDNDTAVTSWMTLALTTAVRMDVGLAPLADLRHGADMASLRGAAAWLMRMTSPDDGCIGYQNRGGGRAYRKPDEGRGRGRLPGWPVLRPNDWSLTAAGLLAGRRIALARCEDPGAEPTAAQSLRGVAANAPYSGSSPREYADVHAAWFGARLLRGATGSLPSNWQEGLGNLARSQLATGAFPPDGAFSREGGAVYTTALATLTLQQGLRE